MGSQENLNELVIPMSKSADSSLDFTEMLDILSIKII